MDNFVFIDTEFTDLANPALLSLGMVAGGQEFYAELDTKLPAGAALIHGASPFVRREVLSQWGRIPGAAVSPPEFGRHAAQWLRELAADTGRVLIVAHTHPADWLLLQQCLERASAWAELEPRLRPADVSLMVETPEGRAAAEWVRTRLSARGIGFHHALADALALQAAYQCATEPREVAQ